MFFDQKKEDKLHKTQLKMKELSIQLDKLSREYDDLLSKVGLTEEELETHVNNSANFSSESRGNLEKEKKKLNEMLELAINHIPDSRKVKKTMAERGAVQQTWLYVR